MKGTVSMSWGPWGGFYIHRRYIWRVCLGFVAFTYMPIEVDDLLESHAKMLEARDALNSGASAWYRFGTDDPDT